MGLFARDKVLGLNNTYSTNEISKEQMVIRSKFQKSKMLIRPKTHKAESLFSCRYQLGYLIERVLLFSILVFVFFRKKGPI